MKKFFFLICFSLFIHSIQAEEKAYFAGGSFWGMEYFFLKEKGVLKTTVGYMGGTTNNPSYHEVCNGNSGHAEAIEIIFDPHLVSYELLAKVFFEIHDPTLKNNSQYRSAIFYITKQQKKIAQALIEQLRKKGFSIVTELSRANAFYPAEEYHQRYYEKHRINPCHCLRKSRF